jgi:predicted ATPase
MPRFQRAPARASWPQPEPGVCYLKDDNWDDFGFKTLFVLGVVSADGVLRDIGRVKITKRGLESGRVTIPDDFDGLDEAFCSLGQDQNYYEQLAMLPAGQGSEILYALRDCAADPIVWERFQEERSVQVSLLRSVSSSLVERTFRDIVRGQAPSTPYEFVFQVAPLSDSQPRLDIDVRVHPHATPPTNVHVLIGRNGVGKSRMLAGISAALTGADGSAAFGMEGSIAFHGETAEAGRFANLVTVAFSAFDRFAPLNAAWIKGDIRYAYIGLKQEADENSPRSVFKTPDELADEFGRALQACLEGSRQHRWNKTLEILSTDPGFAELEVSGTDALSSFDTEAFQRLSSGHKIVLLTAARLVELVDERTLVLLDEPESHLHPPLLSSFIRALSNLLVLRNGVAIVATHSPVVLQEVPRSCVWVLRRSGDLLHAERPATETFGENVGILTHEIFQLEVTESGFHKMLADAAAIMSYEDILEQFGSQIGAEGRAIARALTTATRR